MLSIKLDSCKFTSVPTILSISSLIKYHQLACHGRLPPYEMGNDINELNSNELMLVLKVMGDDYIVDDGSRDHQEELLCLLVFLFFFFCLFGDLVLVCILLLRSVQLFCRQTSVRLLGAWFSFSCSFSCFPFSLLCIVFVLYCVIL